MTEIFLKCEDPRWVGQYQRLLQDGFSAQALDQGYFRVRLKENPSPNETALERFSVGKGDGKIECEEIAEKTIDHYESYSSFIEETTGRQVPWVLKETRKIDEAIEHLKKAIHRQGFKPGEKEFDGRLFTGLYIFANTPQKEALPLLKERDLRFWRKLFSPLMADGLGDFAEWVQAEGGLGLGFTREDFPFEGTAAETLQQSLGFCTERTKVLYAVLKRAGLNPTFAYVSTPDWFRHWRNLFNGAIPFALPPNEVLNGHVMIALPLASGKIYADFIWEGQPWVDWRYASYSLDLSLREFLQAEMSNLVGEKIRNGQEEEALRFIEGGLVLGKSSMSYHLLISRAELAIRHGDKIKFLETILQILEMNPAFQPPPNWIVSLSMDERLWKETEKRWVESAKRDPTLHAALARIYLDRKKFDRAKQEARAALDNGFTAPEVWGLLGEIAHDREEWAVAEKNYRESLQMNPSQARYHYRLGIVLGQQKKYADALQELSKAWALTPPLSSLARRILYYLAHTTFALGDLESAKDYLQLLWQHSFFPDGGWLFLEYRVTQFPIASAANLLPELAARIRKFREKEPNSLELIVSQIHIDWHNGKKEEAERELQKLTPTVENISRGLGSLRHEDMDRERLQGLDVLISFLGDEILRKQPETYRRFYTELHRVYTSLGLRDLAESAKKRAERF